MLALELPLVASSGAAELKPRARLARRNLGPFLPYERQPDGLFKHARHRNGSERSATQARKAARLNRRRRYGEPRFGQKRG